MNVCFEFFMHNDNRKNEDISDINNKSNLNLKINLK